MYLGQACGVAFLDTVSCRKSGNIFVNGNAETPWFEGKKVCLSIQNFLTFSNFHEMANLVHCISNLLGLSTLSHLYMFGYFFI